MKSFVRLDDTLIDHVFQPLVDWIANHLAFGWARIACLGADLSALAWVVSQAHGMTAALGLPGSGGHAAAGEAGFRITLIVLGLGSLMVLRTLFQRVGGTAGQGGNPLRAGMQLHRAVCLAWLAGLSVKTASGPAGLEPWALLAMGVFGTFSVYVAACSNPPPKRQERRAPDRGWRLAAATG